MTKANESSYDNSISIDMARDLMLSAFNTTSIKSMPTPTPYGKQTELGIKVNKAIEALRMFEPEDEPYYLAYSGGKDSDCIRILAELAGVKHEIVHNLTTVDAPETVQYIKTVPNVIINKARWADGTHKTMWNLIPHQGMPPLRIMRYCCEHLKEQGGKGRLKITGVRASESRNRA